MRVSVAIFGATLLFSASSIASALSDADAIENELRQASSVSFYFVSRTEDYDYDAKKMQSEASVVVRRSCGANCHNFMGSVLTSLRASKQTKCMPGQQDLLIRFGRGQLTYSYSGRQAMYEGRCYFNPTGIHTTLKADGFFFH
jgi:hypothetical protein